MQFGSKPPSQVFFIGNLILGILDSDEGRWVLVVQKKTSKMGDYTSKMGDYTSKMGDYICFLFELFFSF